MGSNENKKKKPYVKPGILIEHFEMSQNIATSCDYTFKNLQSSESCRAEGGAFEGDEVDKIVVFADPANGCNTIENEDFCVFVATGSSTFSS